MFKRTMWKDRAVQKPRTYRQTGNADGSVTLTPEPGTIYEAGTPVNAAQLERMEQGIWDAYIQSGAMFLENAILSLTETDGKLRQIDEKVANVLRRRTILGYIGEDLTTARVIIYAEDGSTVLMDYTDTLSYSNGALVSVGRAVAV